MGLCEYKNIFGEPNTGAHSIRVFNFAIVDILATILLGYLFSKLTKINLTVSIVSMFILGIISHRLFCVRTTVDKILFPSS
jgi:hypothetical protein